MSIDELAEELRTMRETARPGRKLVMPHLFGVKYARELAGMDLIAIAMLAGCEGSLSSEIHKGCVLAEYVCLKREVA